MSYLLLEGKAELEALIKKKEDELEKYFASLKDHSRITVSALHSNLESELGSLQLALLHRDNALKWFKDILETLKKAEEKKRV